MVFSTSKNNTVDETFRVVSRPLIFKINLKPTTCVRVRARGWNALKWGESNAREEIQDGSCTTAKNRRIF